MPLESAVLPYVGQIPVLWPYKNMAMSTDGLLSYTVDMSESVKKYVEVQHTVNDRCVCNMRETGE